MSQQNRRQFMAKAALGTLGLGTISTAASASQVSLTHTSFVSVSDYGAVGDGLTDDTVAIQNAINAAISQQKALLLNAKHLITDTLLISGDLLITSDSITSDITSSTISTLFDFSGQRLVLEKLNTIEVTLVSVTQNFSEIVIRHCRLEGAYDSLNEYIVNTYGISIEFDHLMIDNNTTRYMSGLYGDELYGGHISFSRNTMFDSTRFILRALNNSNDGPRSIRFIENQILSMNSTLADSSTAARVVQADARDAIYVVNNEVRNLFSDTAANLIYFRTGNLMCTGNSCYNAYGGEAWIHDKGVGIGNHMIKGNLFDQSDVLEYDLDCIIKIYTGHNFSVVDNDFIGLRSPACWVYESVDVADSRPTNNVILGNTVRNIQYPFAFKLVQPSSNSRVANNTVINLSNPDGIVQHGESTPKFIFIYVSFNNADNIENVSVDNNTLMSTQAGSEFIEIYRHTISTTTDIKNLYITGNTALDVSTLCRFTGMAIDSCVLANNAVPSGAITFVGANPPIEFREANNLN